MVALCKPIAPLYSGALLISVFRALAALENSKLFSSLILIDPVMIKPCNEEEAIIVDGQATYLVSGALNRRSTWSSKYVVLTW